MNILEIQVQGEGTLISVKDEVSSPQEKKKQPSSKRLWQWNDLFVLIRGNLGQGSRKIWMYTFPFTYSHAGIG